MDTLAKPSLGNKLAVKVLRYVVFGAAPGLLGGVPELAAVGGAVGLAAGAVDTFLVDRFLRPGGPKVMIDRLRPVPSARARG